MMLFIRSAGNVTAPPLLTLRVLMMALAMVPFGTRQLFAESAADLPHTVVSPEAGWPQFRGPGRDGISAETGLLESWPEGGPQLVWSFEKAGKGYSSPIIANNRLFITGDHGDELHIFALNLNGEVVWQAKNGASWKGEYPAARASVTYSEGRIYHENAHGRIGCFDAQNGQEIWSINVLERFRGENITWGLSECLLVDERAVYATVGGSEALVVALDKANGKVLWKSEPLRDSDGERRLENASYASPILVRYGQRRLVIGCSLHYLYCVDADSGALQFTRKFPTTYGVLAMMPAIVGDGVFMTAPHGKGGHLLRLVPPATPHGSIGFAEGWSTRLDTLQGSVLYVHGKVFGSYYPGRKGWAAIDARTGDVLFEAPDLVKGAALFAETRLYALCEDGWMYLLQPAEKEFAVNGRFRFADANARDAWAHPVIHQGRLYLRYHEALRCYEIAREKRAAAK